MDNRPYFRTRRAASFMLDEVLGNTILGLLGSVVPVAGSAVAVCLYSSSQDSLAGVGRSPGRALVKQRLAMTDGTQASHLRCFARNTLRWLLWVTILCFLIDLVLFCTSDGRLIADRICDTRVWDQKILDDVRYLNGVERELLL